MSDRPPPPPRPPVRGARWHVQLLGRLAIHSGDLPVTGLRDQAARLLLAHLALQPRVRHDRLELAQRLWPQVLDDDGRDHPDADRVRKERLRKLLHKVNVAFRAGGRQVVPALQQDSHDVSLNAEAFDIDVQRFERHVEHRQWAQARAAYGGPLLPGLVDEWLQGERQRLEAAYLRASDELARLDGHADTDAAPAEADDPPAAVAVPAGVPLCGREDDLERLRTAVQQHVLVTLHGTGGVGKTRVAGELLRRQARLLRVVPVWLEHCGPHDDVVEQLRGVLELAASPRPPLDQVVEHLAGAPALVLLDNFEQLADTPNVQRLAALMAALPMVRWVVTSRVALGLQHEHVLPLQPLPVPDREATAERASLNPAVALFTLRAQAAHSGFVLHARNVGSIVEVCQLLEGLPLAIELAAAKIRTVKPAAMVQGLRRGIELLRRPRSHGDLADRHLSLEAALAFSHELLDEPARALLFGLSVFSGGWTESQARALLPPQTAWQALDTLVRHAWLHTPPGHTARTRLTMLQPVREFVRRLAAERCTAAQLRAQRHAHRQHFLAAAQALQAQGRWHDEADQSNLVEALATGLDDGDITTSAAIAQAVSEAWRSRGLPARVLDLLHTLASHDGLPAPARVSVLALLSNVLVSRQQLREAHGLAVQALALAGNHPLAQAEATLAQADVHLRAGIDDTSGPRVMQLLQQAQALLDRMPAGDRQAARLRVRLLLWLGAVTLEHLKDPAAAMALFERAERLAGELGDARAAVLAVPGRTACLLRQARYRETVAVAGKGEQTAAALGDVLTRLQLCDRLSNAYEELGQHEQQLQACQRQVQLALRHGLEYYAGIGMWNQATALVHTQQHELAAEVMASAQRYWETEAGALAPHEQAHVARVRALVRDHVGAARLRAAWDHGWTLPRGDALSLGAGRERPPGIEPPPR